MLIRMMGNKKGQSAVEYVLILALIVMALVGTYTAFREQIAGMFTRVGGQLESIGGTDQSG